MNLIKYKNAKRVWSFNNYANYYNGSLYKNNAKCEKKDDVNDCLFTHTLMFNRNMNSDVTILSLFSIQYSVVGLSLCNYVKRLDWTQDITGVIFWRLYVVHVCD